MNETWSLDELYLGYDEPSFHSDFAKFKDLIDQIDDLSDELSDKGVTETLVEILQLEEQYVLISSKLGSYLSLRQATNTTDGETATLLGQLERLHSMTARSIALFDIYIENTENLQQIIASNKFLKEYEFLLKEIHTNGIHRMDEGAEEVYSKMNISAGQAWSNLQEYLTSTLAVTYEGKQITLSEVRNLAYDPDANVRKQAYEAELRAYEPIKQSVAFALNSIKSQVISTSELRSFSSPLKMTLHHSRMKMETLEAMIHAIQAYLPIFHKYLKRKAKLLGHTNGLPWYDLFAPMQQHDKKYTLEEAKTYLLDHFTPFASDMADMMERAFDEAWIDFYPKPGKVGGAFCANLPFMKQSRVLTNFDGTLSDIITLAHELGHAYHGMMIETHRPLNTDYTMPVAETASTFNETIVMNAAIAEEKDPQAQLALIESQLQDLTQIICDIYSRFLFEQAVFEKRQTSFMFADELCDMMIEAQKKAYGDALDPTTLHPYMWINKSHYYSASLSFYNFPYAFGGLFARGLVAQYEKEGPAFVDKYRKMLHATTVSSVEDIAKMAGIDLTSMNFWQTALDTCKERIEQFLTLSETIKPFNDHKN